MRRDVGKGERGVPRDQHLGGSAIGLHKRLRGEVRKKAGIPRQAEETVSSVPDVGAGVGGSTGARPARQLLLLLLLLLLPRSCHIQAPGCAATLPHSLPPTCLPAAGGRKVDGICQVQLGAHNACSRVQQKERVGGSVEWGEAGALCT